jgi:hypothetical protein
MALAVLLMVLSLSFEPNANTLARPERRPPQTEAVNEALRPPQLPPPPT